MSYIGRRIGDFVIVSRLALRDRAIMFRAYQQSVDRDVALKLIPMEGREPAEAVKARFLGAAQRMAALEHVHIVPVYSYGVTDDVPHDGYIAMRLMRGGSLEDYLNGYGGRPLPLALVERFFMQAASALIYAHAHGLNHHNLKPSNILLDEQANAYVSDFGLLYVSIPLERTPHPIQTELPVYLPPEQIRGQKADEKADVYSLGMVLYRMLTGRVPFDTQSSSVTALLSAVEHKNVIAPRKLNPSIPAALELTVIKAIRRNPADRFPTIEAFTEAVDRAFTVDVVSKRTRTSTGQFRRITRQLPSLWLIAVISIFAVCAAVMGLVIRSRPVMPMLGNIVDVSSEAPDEVMPTEGEAAAARMQVGDGFIAYIACATETETQVARIREMTDLAASYGISFRAYDSQYREYRQISMIERAHTEGAAAIIVCPLGENAEPAIESAQRAGIPTIMTALMPTLYADTVYAGVDGYQLGYQAGQYAGAMITDEYDGQARVLLIGFELPFDPNGRARGLRAGLLDAAPDADIIGMFNGGAREDARDQIARLLNAGEPFDLILCYADVCAYGAIDALEAAQVPPDAVKIISINGESLALNYIERDYYLWATQTVNRELGSQVTMGAAIKLLGGGDVPRVVRIPPGELVSR